MDTTPTELKPMTPADHRILAEVYAGFARVQTGEVRELYLELAEYYQQRAESEPEQVEQ